LKLPHPPRRDDECCDRREKLANWRKEAGKQEGLPSHVILPKDLLDTITARPLSSQADLKSRMAISPSRYQRYGQEIYQLLTKETS
jgi:ribonuclease D